MKEFSFVPPLPPPHAPPTFSTLCHHHPFLPLLPAWLRVFVMGGCCLFWLCSVCTSSKYSFVYRTSITSHFSKYNFLCQEGIGVKCLLFDWEGALFRNMCHIIHISLNHYFLVSGCFVLQCCLYWVWGLDST